MFGLARDSADGALPPPTARLPDLVEAAIVEGEAEATVGEGVAGADGSADGAGRGCAGAARTGECAGGAGGADGAGSVGGAGGAAGGAGGGCGSQVRGQCQASVS